MRKDLNLLREDISNLNRQYRNIKRVLLLFGSSTLEKSFISIYPLTTGAVTDYIGKTLQLLLTDLSPAGRQSRCGNTIFKETRTSLGESFSFVKFIFPIFSFFVKHFVFLSWTVRDRKTPLRGSIPSGSEPRKGQPTTINDLVTEIDSKSQSDYKQDNPTNNKAFQLPLSRL